MADLLNTVANVSQLVDLGLTVKQASNDDIMNELQKQNMEYFEKILERLDLLEQKIKNL